MSNANPHPNLLFFSHTLVMPTWSTLVRWPEPGLRAGSGSRPGGRGFGRLVAI